MIRSLMAVMIVVLTGALARGQQAAVDSKQAQGEAKPGYLEFPDQTELNRRIGLYEAAERSAEKGHLTHASMVKIYSNLTALYEDAGMYPQSEGVMRRWILLLRAGPQDELAEAISHLAALHVVMKDLRQAEKEQMQALRIRENIGDPVGIALSQSDLADLYIKQRHFRQALDDAQKAMAVLAEDAKVDVANRIAVRETLAFALCGLKQCAAAIPVLKDAIELANISYGEDSLSVGVGTYILGYTAWQQGDMAHAGAWMERGTSKMKANFASGQAIYIKAMAQYAHFLRQRGQLEMAAAAEREMRQANAVVDARTLSGGLTAFAGTW
jgi:tetratricopeptide (TPR) repeat protein